MIYFIDIDIFVNHNNLQKDNLHNYLNKKLLQGMMICT